MTTHTETSLKSGFELLQTLSRLFHLVRFVKCWQFFPGDKFQKTVWKFRNWRKKVVFLRSHPPKNVKFGWVSRRRSAVTTKKCAKKRDARAKLLFCYCIPISFLPFSLTSPSPTLATERERHLTTGKCAERNKLDFRYPIWRSTIGQASCLIACTVVNWRSRSVAKSA